MRETIALLLLPACLCSAFAGAAEHYPERSIRLVVPTGAGGNTDVFARILAEKLRAGLGQQVIVDNRPGADGIVGSEIVAKGAPDGYTLLMAFPTHPVNPFLHAKLPYDTLKDFAPVTMVTSVTQVLLVHPKLPARSVKELLSRIQCADYSSRRHTCVESYNAILNIGWTVHSALDGRQSTQADWAACLCSAERALSSNSGQRKLVGALCAASLDVAIF
jgi:hypothetical protein